jgi:hypothetical protein
MKSLSFSASASVVMFAVALAGCGAGAQMATQHCYVNGHESDGACYCFPVGSSCTISYHSITPGHILQVPAPPVQPGAGPARAGAQTRGRGGR